MTVFITVILLYILISQINIADIIKVTSKISLLYILLGFLAYMLFNFFRVLRFRTLLSGKLTIWDLTLISLVHGMFLNLLPSRTGELSFIYLVKNKRIPVGEGISTLLISRSFDTLAVSVLFFISVLFLKDVPQLVSNALVIISICFFLIIIFLMLMLRYGELSIKVLCDITKKLRLYRYRFIIWSFGKIEETIKSLEVIKSRDKIFSTFIYSMMIWISGYLVYLILLSGMGINLSIWAVIIGATFIVFASFLFQGFAGLGTLEGSWALAFITLGVPKEMAILSGFSFHIFKILYSVIPGVISYFILKFK